MNYKQQFTSRTHEQTPLLGNGQQIHLFPGWILIHSYAAERVIILDLLSYSEEGVTRQTYTYKVQRGHLNQASLEVGLSLTTREEHAQSVPRNGTKQYLEQRTGRWGSSSQYYFTIYTLNEVRRVWSNLGEWHNRSEHTWAKWETYRNILIGKSQGNTPLEEPRSQHGRNI
jgi:hypothetical protein